MGPFALKIEFKEGSVFKKNGVRKESLLSCQLQGKQLRQWSNIYASETGLVDEQFFGKKTRAIQVLVTVDAREILGQGAIQTFFS